MKFLVASLIALMVWPDDSLADTLQAQAQSQRRERMATPKASSARTRARAPRAFPKLGGSYKYWNERVEGKRGADVADIEMQFTGLGLHHSYNQYFSRSRWRKAYTGEVAGGFVKGKGATGVIGDGLKDQGWVSLTLTPGIVRRISSAAEVGFGVPVSYRFIFWKLKDSNFSMDKGSSFSVGGEIYLLNNLSPRSTVRVAVAQHYMWETTLFSVGWEWRPKQFLWSRLF